MPVANTIWAWRTPKAKGVDKNDKLSFDWLVKAEDQGFAPATQALNTLHGGIARIKPRSDLPPLPSKTESRVTSFNESNYNYSLEQESESGDSKADKTSARMEAERASHEADMALINGTNSEKYRAAKEKADTALRRSNMSQRERADDIAMEESRILAIQEESNRQAAQSQQMLQEQERNQRLAEISENLNEMKKIEKRRQIEEANKPPPSPRTENCSGQIDQWGRVDMNCN
jgi:hypothetical protein